MNFSLKEPDPRLHYHTQGREYCSKLALRRSNRLMPAAQRSRPGNEIGIYKVSNAGTMGQDFAGNGRLT